MADFTAKALGLATVDEARTKLTSRAATRKIVAIDDPRNLKMRWEPKAAAGLGGFVISPPVAMIQNDGDIKEFFRDNEYMEVTETGVQSMRHHADLSMPVEIEPTNLPRMFTESIKSKMGKMQGLNFITGMNAAGKRRLEAFVPGKMNPISDLHLMDGVFERIVERYGDEIRGIKLNNYGESERRYSVIFGKNPIAREGTEDIARSTWASLDCWMDDLGLGPSSVSVGLHRIICSNNALGSFWTAGNAKWNRLGNNDKFSVSIANVINIAGRFAVHVGRALELAHQEQIPDAEEILDGLYKHDALTLSHREAAKELVTRDDPQTGFDLFQVLTDSAKQLTMEQQKKGESRAVEILMAGGFVDVALTGLDKNKVMSGTQACLS